MRSRPELHGVRASLFAADGRDARRAASVTTDDCTGHSATVAAYTAFVHATVIATAVIVVAPTAIAVAMPTVVATAIAAGVTVDFARPST